MLLQDGENVLFVSTHGFGRHFYPGSGATVGLDGNPVKPSESSPGIINFGVTKDTPSSAWRHEVLTVILPQIANFSPDLILISAGFDAHKKVGTVMQVQKELNVHVSECIVVAACFQDTVNHGYIGLVEDDYEWVTLQLMKLANACCKVRVHALCNICHVRALTLASTLHCCSVDVRVGLCLFWRAATRSAVASCPRSGAALQPTYRRWQATRRRRGARTLNWYGPPLQSWSYHAWCTVRPRRWRSCVPVTLIVPGASCCRDPDTVARRARVRAAAGRGRQSGGGSGRGSSCCRSSGWWRRRRRRRLSSLQARSHGRRLCSAGGEDAGVWRRVVPYVSGGPAQSCGCVVHVCDRRRRQRRQQQRRRQQLQTLSVTRRVWSRGGKRRRVFHRDTHGVDTPPATHNVPAVVTRVGGLTQLPWRAATHTSFHSGDKRSLSTAAAAAARARLGASRG